MAAITTPRAPAQRSAMPRMVLARRSSIIANAQPLLPPRTQDMAGDPFGLLMSKRIVFLGGEVNDFSADALISQLLLLDSQVGIDDLDDGGVLGALVSSVRCPVSGVRRSTRRRSLARWLAPTRSPHPHPPLVLLLQDPSKPIKLFINSPGGSVTAGMGIYDAMMMCQSDVETYCFGLAASMGAFLLGAGTKGKRYSMPNSRIMIHQPLGGASGAAVDIEIQAKEIMYHKANLNKIMANYTGQTIETIEEDTDRDRYMSPLEAKKYGLIDAIVGGDEAVFDLKGSTTEFPKTKSQYVSWGDDDMADGSSGSRFIKPLEPYTEKVEGSNS